MKIPNQSYVKVIKCSESHHNGMTGHVISKRLRNGYNLKLTNHENCSAKEVELLVAHKTLGKEEIKVINWWDFIPRFI